MILPLLALNGHESPSSGISYQGRPRVIYADEDDDGEDDNDDDDDDDDDDGGNNDYNKDDELTKGIKGRDVVIGGSGSES